MLSETENSKLFKSVRNTIAETPNTNKTMISELINKTNGRFFSIVYKNQKNEVAKYVVRTGVWKHLKGGKNYCPAGAVTLYAVSKDGDKQKAGYRSMYLERILSIKSKHLSPQA